MVKNESFEVRALRERHRFYERFDLTLACAFEPEVEKGCESRFQFYDLIGKVGDRLGKKFFLPHRHADLNNWDPRKLVEIINGIIVPTSDLVVGYIGIDSHAAGIILGQALNSGVPVSYLYEEHAGLDSLKCAVTEIGMPSGKTRSFVTEPGFRGKVYDLIEFRDDTEGLQKLELSLKKFYSIS